MCYLYSHVLLFFRFSIKVSNAVAALTDKAQLLLQRLCDKKSELDSEKAQAEEDLANQVERLAFIDTYIWVIFLYVPCNEFMYNILSSLSVSLFYYA